ncbi:DNA mismatch repair protein [Magnaporthiopsis poae ATCC 64411]|uniref:DNA mismatch repair protein n=1 Tax=Magnaporthiopsis poae (strain ATCC 64411 / 73-15) TaxID=644358 RepID=A0A0C4DX96_MAGP6|nr:DNA mismatch repair protein [Magnaporthiopsis poae ATCC 64411]
MSIKPLPPDVVAQIKSSSFITSLNGVVLGLLRNSLDAKATKVNASVDFRLGNCSLEDNGVGIPCAEFMEDGGLAKPHFTSKYPPSEGVYGRSGLFIYSVASLSLLSIASHHRLQNSHNFLLVHNSQIVARHTPALPSQQLLNFPHGTRVTVRDLFGSMPVRVKQRALDAERPGASRDWDQLVRMIVALLLAFPGEVSVTLRESSSTRFLNLRAGRHELASRASHLLLRASLWDHAGPDCWVPLGASSSGITVDGCISLVPAATKRLQFISFGIEPLPEDLGSSVLLAEVNKVFANSKFGTVEDGSSRGSGHSTPAVTEKEYTASELRVKKGIDRWPVFYIRISLGVRATNRAMHPDDFLDEHHDSLPMIVDLLRAISYTFLKKYYFSPRRVNLDSQRKSPTSTSPDQFPSGYGGDSGAGCASSRGARSSPLDGGFGVRPASMGLSEHLGSESEGPDSDKDLVPQNPDSPGVAKGVGNTPGDSANLRTPTVPAEELWQPARSPVGRPMCQEESLRNDCAPEGTFFWDDAATGARSLVDARTGFILPARPKRTPQTSEPPERSIGGGSTPGGKEPSPWLKDVLSRWNNPVFETTEASIPRLPDVETTLACATSSHKHGGCCSVIFGHRDDKASLAVESRISKADLRRSQVISQVDEKFILVKVPVPGLHGTGAVGEGEDDGKMGRPQFNRGTVLVLIDQHAADERCRVEALMQEYFEDVGGTKTDAMWRARTEHLEHTLWLDLSSQDCVLLERFRFHFERWGILYHVSSSDPTRIESAAPGRAKTGTIPDKSGRDGKGILVTSLPPAIMERCRTEPKMLAELLRTEAWRLEGDQTLARSADTAQGFTGPASGREGEETPWISRFHGCPQGILNLINSRACRSAIMFNDPLSLDDCQTLLSRLGACAFPFQCAHGRPSMVPLLDLGQEPPLGDLSNDFGDFEQRCLSQFAP